MAEILVTARADEVAAGAASATFPTLLMTTTGVIGQYRYQYVSTVTTWIAQGATPTASAGPGSALVPAGVIVTIDGKLGAKLAVIEDSTAGKSSLTPLITV